MTFPVALSLSRSGSKHRIKIRDFARSAVKRVSVPKSIRKLAEMPMTLMGIGLIASAVTILTVVGGLMFIGIALIGLEYLISDD